MAAEKLDGFAKMMAMLPARDVSEDNRKHKRSEVKDLIGKERTQESGVRRALMQRRTGRLNAALMASRTAGTMQLDKKIGTGMGMAHGHVCLGKMSRKK